MHKRAPCLNIELLVANIDSEKEWRERYGRPPLTGEEERNMWAAALRTGNLSEEQARAALKDRKDHHLYA